MKKMEEQNEMMLLERVFLRLGSADTDEQLENTLKKLLCPVLLKISSKTEGVQKKVMELLVHVNKRIKSRPKVQLPVDDLMIQYANPETSAFVTNFTIIYIKIGFPRIDNERKLQLIPDLLKCYNGRPQPQQISILQMIMPCFQYMKPAAGTRIKPDILGLKAFPDLTQTVLKYMTDIILLPYNYKVGKPAVSPASSQAESGADSPFNGPPPGMSETAYKSVTGDTPPTSDELEKIKLGVIEVLGGDTFSEQDVLCHLLIGTADSRHSVASAADREMKKIVGNQDWNNTVVIAKLYSIFMGTVLLKGKTMKSEGKRSPASVQMRLKVFPYFLKSREACNQFPASIQIVFDCLYGANTNARLKVMAVQFVHHLCLHCADNKLKPVAQVLLNGMTKLISESQDDAKLRSLAYVAVGKISRRVPDIVGKDVGLLQTFFDSLCKEESENRLAVQEALSLMSEAFSNIDDSGQRQVEALIMQNIEKAESQARVVAVQYAHAVFPADHVPSRYVLLLACGDKKDDVQTEAMKLLRSPLKAKMESKLKTGPSEPKKIKACRLLPTFNDMVSYIKLKASQRIKTQNRYVSGNNTLAFNPASYGQMIIYLRLCLCYDAGIDIDIESIDNMQEQSPNLAPHLSDLLDKESNKDNGPVSEYIDMIRKLLNAVPNATSLYCLLEVVAVVRQRLAPHFIKHRDWIKNMMFSTREDIRVYAAELYALISVYGQATESQTEIVQQLTENLSSQAFEGQHGSLLCLGHLIGYVKSHDNMKVEEMETDQGSGDEKFNTALTEAVVKIASFIENTQLLLALAACTALGEIGRKTALPLASDAESGTSKHSLVKLLVDIVNSDKQHNKLRERASMTAGYLCIGEAGFPYTQEVSEGLLKCAGPKQFELHMTVGEALVCAVLGPSSPAARDIWIVSEKQFTPPENSDVSSVKTLLDLLLSKYASSPNPYIRQAACVWLLALTKQCGQLSIMQKELLNIQSAFMELLNENDEMTQDIASKGLGVVYENCSSEQKQELVSMLVETLTTGKKRQQKITKDTQVFAEGSMGKTPDGKNLTTYRELCSIANDLNQPDLIYKFMHLANHNAVWNSKKGAAFGFSTIAAQAGEQLAPYLHKIVPKMYRYQFDPNPKIQQAMGSIWNALVTDSKKTVDKYMNEILADLMKNLTNTQWRVRESSCIALTDLLRGRPLDDVIEHLPELWNICFRVRDDIKESVRNAADTACKALSRACIKICDPDYGKAGVKATSLILPCLLQTGLDSQVQEVRALSLATILKISKSAGVLLKPHIPLLVYVLLEALSTLEPQYINYISLHVASSQDTMEKLDSARVAASKTSPMMEVVNYCIPFIDEAVLSELVPRLTDLIKSAIGIGTKAGVANFLNSLTHQCPKLLEPHAGKLLGALLNGLNDRNVTIKKTFGSTIGHLAKVAKDSSVEKLILRLKEWYFEKEDESMRTACGTTLQAITQRSPDVLKRHGAIALPLAFLAMHQKPKEGSDPEKSNNVWQEVWLETTPGTEAGIKLYIKELVDISQVALQSQSWEMKAQGASAMETIASKLGGKLGSPHLEMVLSTLLSGLVGRTWTGKESLLKALSSVCVSCRESVSSSKDPELSTIIDAMIKECKKENIKYKVEAVRYTGDILEAHDIDKFSEMSAILFPLLEKQPDKDDTESMDRNTRLALEEVAYKCLGQAWSSNCKTQETYCLQFHQLLCSALKSSVWRVEVAVLKTYNRYLQQLCCLSSAKEVNRNPDLVNSVIKDIVPLLSVSLGNVKYSTIRSEAMTVLETICTRLKECDKLSILQTGDLQKTLQQTLQNMSTDLEPGLSDRANVINKTLS